MKRITLIFTSLIATFLFLEIALQVVHFFYKGSLTQKLEKYANDHIRILCIGESTTAFGGNHSYPYLLQKHLNTLKNELKYMVYNDGMPGASTEEIRNKVSSNIKKYSPHVVIAMIGINDTWWIKSKGNSFWENFRLYKMYKAITINFNPIKKKSNFSDRFQRNFEQLVKESNYSAEKYSAYLHGLHYYYYQQYLDSERAFDYFLENPPLIDSNIRKNIAKAYIHVGRIDDAFKLVTPIKSSEILSEIVHTLYQFCDSYSFREYQSINKILKTLQLFKETSSFFYRQSQTYYAYANYHYAIFNQHIGAKKLEKKKVMALNVFIDIAQNMARNTDIYRDHPDIYYRLVEAYTIRKEYKKVISISSQFFKLSQNYTSNDAIHLITMRTLYSLIMLNKRNEAISFAHTLFTQKPKTYSQKWKRLFFECLNNKNSASCGTFNTPKSLITKQKAVLPKYLKPILSEKNSRRNYVKIVEKYLESGAIVILMQYPLRSITSIKDLFIIPPLKVHFLENKEPFKSLLEKGILNYEDLFIDAFAGNFGHATATGNKLIMQNVYKMLKQIGIIKSK